MNTPCIIGIVIGLMTPAIHAGPRTSASYSITTETADAGGTRSMSTNYTHDGSLGGISGVSTVATPTETAKHGFIAQLYEVTALNISASPITVNEGLTRQLSGTQLLDDNTTIAVPANSITWSVQSGPLTGINSSGLATAGNVYQNATAVAQGSFGGNTATLGLTVFDTIPDNFGAYAADGLGDDWQVQFFGQNNPDASPFIDADFDGQTNAFEFTAGLIPTDSQSVFHWRIEPVPGLPLHKKIVFSPVLPGRSYTVKFSPTLGTGAIWQNLAGGIVTDTGDQRTVTDTAASGARKFYKLEILKP